MDDFTTDFRGNDMFFDQEIGYKNDRLDVNDRR